MAVYDALADDYAEKNAQTPPDLVAFRESFAARVERGGRVADLGCGPGRDCVALVRLGLRVVGVDLSHQMALRSSHAGATIVRGDLRRPPLRDQSLDGIWAAASLLHVPSGELVSTLAAWRRLLRRGGTLGFSTSLGAGEGWEAVGNGLLPQQSPSERRQWFVNRHPDSLVAALADTEFALISTGEQHSHRHWLQVLAAAS